MEKRFLLFKTECKWFGRNERYALRTAGGRNVIAVVGLNQTKGLTRKEVEEEIGEFEVKMFFAPARGMTHYEEGEGAFFKNLRRKK